MKSTKVSLNKIVSAYFILDKLNNNEKFSFRIHYWCMRNMKEFKDSADFYYTERDKLFESYLKKGEDGNYLTLAENGKDYNFEIKDDKDIVEFKQELNNLETMECSVSPYLIETDYLFNEEEFNLSGSDIFVMDFLFKDK